MYRELSVPFLIGTLTVLFMFQANQMIALFKQYSPTAVPWTATAQLILFDSPKWLLMTLPMATALATSLAFTRITRESEMTAIRSVGVPILRIMRPVMLFGLLVAAGSYYVAEYLQPAAKAASRKLAAELYMKASAPDFQSNVTVKLANKVAIIGTVARGPNNTVQLSNVLLYERPDEDETILTVAERGEYRDGNWTLERPQVWHIQGQTLLSLKPKERMVIKEPISIESLFAPREADELSTQELRAQIVELRRQGADTRRAEIALHKRFAEPAACLVMAIVAPIFAVLFARSGAFVGVLLGLFVVMAYYNVYIVATDILGPNGYFLPSVSAWFTNILFAVVGLAALRRLE